MSRRESLRRPLMLRGRTPLWLAGIYLFAVLGCGPQAMRGKSEDETERDRYDLKIIRDVAMVGNADPVRVGGVGLVTGWTAPAARRLRIRTAICLKTNCARPASPTSRR